MTQHALATCRAREPDREERCDGDANAMAADELGEPVRRAVGSGGDRAPFEKSLHVLGERGRGLVATLDVLLERGHHDEVEVTADATLERRGRLGRRLRRHML